MGVFISMRCTLCGHFLQVALTLIFVFFFLKQKTAYEIDCDWSSDVCSSDPPTALSPEELILFRRENLGFVFQQYNLIPALTAAENVAVPLLAGGVKRQQAVARGKELLATLGMAHRGHALPSQLSGGEPQRVALARALVHEPRLIVCDEPTSALDGRTGHAVMELLSATAVRPGRAVIIVTHDARIFDFADQIAHMDDGRIVSLEENRKNGALANGLAAASATWSLAEPDARSYTTTGD